MASYRTMLFVRRFRNALKILGEKGPQELVARVKDFLRRRGQIDFALRHRETLEYDTSPVGFTGNKLDQQKLAKALQRLQTQSFGLALSQDDYLEVVGGVQLKLADQQLEMNEQGIAYLHLSPFLVRNTLDFSQAPGVTKLYLDGKFVGYADDETLLSNLAMLVKSGTLTDVHLHHLMGWKTDFVAQILSLAGDAPVNFWLHDFFSICPNYFLLRNDREYCHAPDLNSNACQLCVYGSIRPLHFQAFTNLFQRFPIKAIAPSDYALQLWTEKFPTVTAEGRVVPNARLQWDERLWEEVDDQPLRIAFVGYPVLHKGWQTWLSLTNQFGKDPRYKFFHFSGDWQPSSNFEKVAVEVTGKNRAAMTNALREIEINIAFLWSICPETFSFTLFESLAAGCYVITNPASGNIQDTIVRNPQWGKVYADKIELQQAFEDSSILEAFKRFNENTRQTGKLVFESDRD